MIPKIIHYCWFGGKNTPNLFEKCLKSWNIYLPDYELKLWNEKNYDITSVTYVKEAYEKGKYAFVSDYVRLFALYSYGGIYMDIDVEVIKCLDEFLKYPAFTGFESEKDIPTGIMGSEKYGEWVKEQLEYYNGRHFILQDGKCDLTTNTQIISGLMSKNGFLLKNGYQIYKNCMHVFPRDYFCPQSRSGLITITKNTYCIHHFIGSWNPIRYKMKRFIFRRIIGPRATDILIKTKQIIKNKIKNVFA